MSKQTIQVIVLIVLALGAFIYMVVMPKYKEYGKFAEQIEEKRKELIEAEIKQKNLPELERVVEEMQKELAIAEKKLPSGEQVDELLNQIPRVCYEVGVSRGNLANIRFGRRAIKDAYSELPIMLKITEMKFDQFVELLYRFDIFERLLDVTTLSIVIVEPEKNIIGIDANIMIYVFNE